MSLICMGANYKTAPIDVRGTAGAHADDPQALRALLQADGVKEAAALCTCNRVELLLDAKTDRLGAQAAESFFRERLGAGFDQNMFYLYRGQDAVEHAFRVVCSLDSQVLGEAQILGQMKRAQERAQEAGTCGITLTHLFKEAIHLGKRVHAETGLGSDSVSLSTAALKAATTQVPDIAHASILLVGAGEMAQLMARYLADAGCADVAVTSRTLAHAQACAQQLGATAVPFEDRHAAAARADVVFTMVGAAEPVIAAPALGQARERAGSSSRRLVIVDIGVPRNVEPACARLGQVTLIDQEALDGVVDEGLAQRLRAVGAVEGMVQEALEQYLAWMQERYVVPTIKEMYAKGDVTVAGELGRAEKSLAKALGRDLTAEERAVLAAYGNAIMKKILHGPTVRLKKEAGTADSYYYTGAARYLFGLETFPPGTHHHPRKKNGGAGAAGTADKSQAAAESVNGGAGAAEPADGSQGVPASEDGGARG